MFLNHFQPKGTNNLCPVQVTSRDLSLLTVLVIMLTLCRAPKLILHFNKASVESESVVKN
jgi:hypothetical protein